MVVSMEVESQGVANRDITLHPVLLLKVEGTDTAIEIPLGREEDMRAAFAEAHRARFGFDPGDAGDIVLVRVFYRWQLLTPGFTAALANMDNNQYLVTAATVFRNEPFDD